MLAKLTPGETKQFLRMAGAGIQDPGAGAMQDEALGGVSNVLRPPGQSEGRTAPCMVRRITASAAAREGVRMRKSSTMRSMTG